MKKALLWALAVLLTLASAVYQRMTGPTNPLRGKVTLCGKEISFRLERSAENKEIHKVKVKAPEPVRRNARCPPGLASLRQPAAPGR
jgi:hypothetical protein